MTLLSVANLTAVFGIGRGEAAAIEDITLDLAEGKILSLVGESGSGKSITALTIMGLPPNPPATSRRARSCSRARTCYACPTPPCAACAAQASRWCSRNP